MRKARHSSITSARTSSPQTPSKLWCRQLFLLSLHWAESPPATSAGVYLGVRFLPPGNFRAALPVWASSCHVSLLVSRHGAHMKKG